tara:strand:+ start:249 stop:875 length:627 start_codon:yes stop_codon:yes gene_type:complete
MAFSIEKLRTQITKSDGLALSNQFVVVLPRIAGTITETKELNVLCKTATMPGRAMATVPRIYSVKGTEIANQIITDDVTLTFHLLNDWGVKQYFERWHQSVIGNSYYVGYEKEYSSRMSIHHLRKGMSYDFDLRNRGISFASKFLAKFLNFTVNVDFDFDRNYSDKTNYSLVLEDAYPKSVSGVALDNQPDGLLEIQVVMQYRDWRRV